jgi:hypothetical protein
LGVSFVFIPALSGGVFDVVAALVAASQGFKRSVVVVVLDAKVASPPAATMGGEQVRHNLRSRALLAYE